MLAGGLVVALITFVLAVFLATVLLGSTVAIQAAACAPAPTSGSAALPGGPPQPPAAAASGQFTELEWATDFLSRLGVPVSADNQKVIVAWERAEGGHFANDATFNPLNTTLTVNGATSINSVGVKAYPDYETGMAASLTTIRASYYSAVIAALQAGNNPQGVVDAVGASPWGTNRSLFQQVYDRLGDPSDSPGPAVGGTSGGRAGCPPGSAFTPGSWSGGACPGRGPGGETTRPPEEMAVVRGTTIHQCLAAQLEAMMAAAQGDGVTLAGSGYRTRERQIQLRTQNCGSSPYAVYEMPSSSCSPPTARPGFSNHEGGMAVDFSSGVPWLFANANRYGFFNLPSGGLSHSRPFAVAELTLLTPPGRELR